jgi:hypothetical protein
MSAITIQTEHWDVEGVCSGLVGCDILDSEDEAYRRLQLVANRAHAP